MGLATDPHRPTQTGKFFCPGDLPGQKLHALRAAGFAVHHDSVLLRQAAVNRLSGVVDKSGAAG